jgi:hypothetical protein
LYALGTLFSLSYGQTSPSKKFIDNKDGSFIHFMTLNLLDEAEVIKYKGNQIHDLMNFNLLKTLNDSKIGYFWYNLPQKCVLYFYQ